MDDPCNYLFWDSEFFGHNIGQVVGHRLGLERMRSVLRWGEQNRIECIYLLADSDHDETVILAEQNGFHLVDIRITLTIRNLRANIQPVLGSNRFNSGILIRPVQTSDVSSLETIARTAHEDTRFYYDFHFSKRRCSELYATWIRRSCEDFADQVLIAEKDGEPVGYITCNQMPEEKMGSIGLIAVDSSVRGMGIGPTLVINSLEWFAERGIKEVQVVTQGRNIAAQRLYQHCGFLSQSMQLWYHRWFV